MSTCNVFDKYRDGELSPAERSAFEQHLAVCDDCGTKMALLNNIVYAMRQENINPVDQADLIAQQAFSQGTRWDVLVVSWLRPGPDSHSGARGGRDVTEQGLWSGRRRGRLPDPGAATQGPLLRRAHDLHGARPASDARRRGGLGEDPPLG